MFKPGDRVVVIHGWAAGQHGTVDSAFSIHSVLVVLDAGGAVQTLHTNDNLEAEDSFESWVRQVRAEKCLKLEIES